MTSTMTKSQWLRMLEYEERLQQLKRERKIALGEACDPDLAGILDREPLQGRLDFQWARVAKDLNDRLDEVLCEVICDRGKPAHGKFAPITPDKLWLWGGPTPFWGGSMADDCLVREQGKLGEENGVYVYGETSDSMMKKHAGFKKLLCQVNNNCRTPGMLAGTEEGNAELLSKLSLSYPNIVGAMCDDFVTGAIRTLLPERFEKIYRGVKKYNDQLKVYGVIYAHNLRDNRFDFVQPYIDVVNLWLWNKTEILDIDEHVERCREAFPGKPILMGVFLHEYGISDLGQCPEVLIYQLERAGVFLKKGWIEGVVILGGREMRKWPKLTERIVQFLKVDQYGETYR